MRETTLFTLETPYRQPLPVKGWFFGNPDQKSLAVMGALRGNEIQQMYICGRLIRTLTRLEEEGKLSEECGILVVPCANQFSMNVGSRFWAADKTDINRMFPGYDLGETTQRIAARIFAALQGYRYGIQLASFYLPGDFLPHVRMMETGYQHTEEADAFGLPYVLLRTPQPYDTTTLNYNWQIWNTQAFSLYTRETDSIDPDTAAQAQEAILRFLQEKGLGQTDAAPAAAPSMLIKESALETVLSSAGGLLLRRRIPGDFVQAGELLGEILDPCTDTILEELHAGRSGRIFFAHKAQLIGGHEVAYRIVC